MKGRHNIHPYMIIILSFLGVITVGTILLILPWATVSGESIGFVDSLFMATSAVCVTGLSVQNVAVQFSIYGKIVMALLMEVGGLSFITIAVFFFTVLGAKIGVSNRFLLKESLNQSSVKGIISLVKRIVLISASVQLIGAIINIFPLTLTYGYNFWDALGVALFHSASAFNNAGFDIFGADSMIPFKDDLILNLTTMSMIILGGIGFVVIDDIFRNKRWSKLSLHTKITLTITGVLVIGGGFLLKAVNFNEEAGGFSFLQAFFTSVTCRTAGFSTYNMSQLKDHPAAYVICLVLMFIGASPCSTGGGVKTTSLAVVIIAIIYFARGKKARAFHRKISDSNLFKAFVLISFAVMIVIIGTFLVSIIQPEFRIDEVLFEVTSGFSTTGLSMGITNQLNTANRLIICFLMLFGRLGPLTVIGVVNKNWMNASKESIQYVEENVIIG